MQKLLKTGIWIALLAGFGVSHANAGYQTISPPLPPEDTDKIEVIEIFWYGCPHCHDFEPYIDAWLETKPDDVEFKRMPGIFRQNWLPHARAYYAAEVLGVVGEVHSGIFHAMHEEGLHLGDERMIRRVFEQHGVDGDDFSEAYNSAEVENRIKEALHKARRYRVTGVPAVVINGKYLTSGPLAGSFERIIDVMDQLIERERAAKEAAVVDPRTSPATSAR